jgi:hypothetical protein
MIMNINFPEHTRSPQKSFSPEPDVKFLKNDATAYAIIRCDYRYYDALEAQS